MSERGNSPIKLRQGLYVAEGIPFYCTSYEAFIVVLKPCKTFCAVETSRKTFVSLMLTIRAPPPNTRPHLHLTHLGVWPAFVHVVAIFCLRITRFLSTFYTSSVWLIHKRTRRRSSWHFWGQPTDRWKATAEVMRCRQRRGWGRGEREGRGLHLIFNAQSTRERGLVWFYA